MIQRIYREDKAVRINIDSKLGTCKPIFPFSFVFNSQEEAELFVRYIKEEIERWKHDIAQSPTPYLKPYEISQLKRELSTWNIKKEIWS